MNKIWLPILSRILVFLYYHRIRVINSNPAKGSILYVALHRNGAVDGYVYNYVRPRIVFLIAEQLRRSWIGRIFFTGIEVTRSKDRAKAKHPTKNTDAIDACVDHLIKGGALLVMPEGTSDLGHQHLPFQKGAARILEKVLADKAISVVPMTVHYEGAVSWQSDAEVVFGEPISTDLPDDLNQAARIRLLHERIVESLEALAVQAETPELFSGMERMAYAATLGSERSYFSALKALETGLPEAEEIKFQLDELLEKSERKPLLHHGVPLVPVSQPWKYPLAFIILLPLMLSAGLLNAVPLISAWYAGNRFSDGRNTIALWRLLVGFPMIVIWLTLLLILALLTHNLLLWVTYLVISTLGLKLMRRFRKISISSHNFLFVPSLRKHLLEWRDALEKAMRSQDV